jgi:tight adherence protein C
VLSLGYAMTAPSPVAHRLKGLVSEPAGGAMPQPTSRAAGAGFLGRTLIGIGKYGLQGDGSIALRLSEGGMRGPNAAALFLGVRTLLTAGPVILVLARAVFAGAPLGRALMITVASGVGGHLLANMWLKRRARSRGRQLTNGLPDALDLMVVCLEAGLGLNATIAKVGEERSTVDDTVGREFSQVALDLRNGRSRADALRALARRNGTDDLKSLVGIVIQSDKLGASMARTFRIHADLLREKRCMRAEEQARKLPIKVLFPLALFILPTLFIVTVGPALLKIGELSSMMAPK